MNRRRGWLLGRGIAWLPLLGGLLSSCAMGPRVTSTALVVAEAPDATALLLIEAARTDQRNFEVYRRSTFPLAVPLLSGSFVCSEQIGLYCIDRVMGGLARMSSPEEPGVSVAREQLIESLQAANRRMPSDGWIQGQLIRYLVESGNHSAASAAAANCRAEPQWWCFALAGYVYHHSGFGATAYEAYQVALGAMPDEERAHWLDISALLDADVVAEYARLEPDEASNFEERFWFLSDPLLTRPGNEILNEHLTRRVELTLQLDAETVEGPLRDRYALETIGRHDLLLRFGLPSFWIRGMGKMGMVRVLSRGESTICFSCGAANWLFTVQAMESGEFEEVRGAYEARGESQLGPGVGLLAPPRGVRDLIATYLVPPQDLLPPPALLLTVDAEDENEDGGADDDRWDLIRDAPRTAYTIPMVGGSARWISPLSHQLAVFPRGDSAVVVGGWDLPPHGVAGTAEVDAGIALLHLDNLVSPATVEVVDGAAASGVLMVKVAARPSLLSVEAVVPEEQTMARARTELDLAPLAPMRFAISDLLLLHGQDEEVNSLDEAVEIARGSTRVPPGELLGAYWELYGLDPAVQPEVTMSLSLRRPPSGIVGGVLRWLGEAIGVASSADPVRIEWVEEVIGGDAMGRSVTFRVPEVSDGSYALVLTATVPGREPVVAAREVVVTSSTVSPPAVGRLIRRPKLTRPTRCLPETPITASAFSVSDAMAYLRTPRCAYTPDPSWFGHYGGTDMLSEYGYDGW